MKSWATNKQAKLGFTVVELLIAIVVMAILATITIVAYTGIQEDSRDSTRLADANSIAKALNLYFIRHGEYPVHDSGNGSWETSHEDTPADFLSILVDEGLLEEVPVDPVNSNPYYYAYYRYAAGGGGCDSSKGRFFVLAVTRMEASSRPHADSPGWTCATRNWSTEFDWVTGGYEY